MLNPADIAERDEIYSLRRSLGCSVCKFRDGETKWGQSVCGIGKRPEKGRAYCFDWRDSE